MDLAALFDKVKADRNRAPKPMKDWKKKILDPNTSGDDWDFTNLNATVISRRAQFHSAWEEVSLTYVIQPIHCATCGWQHDEHWGIFLHEKHRQMPATERFTRLAKNIGEYRGLTRNITTHEPTISPTCDRCFLLGEPPQLELPLGEEFKPETIEVLATALVEVVEEHEAHVKWKEKKQPEVYDFDTDFGHTQIKEARDEVKAVDELDW